MEWIYRLLVCIPDGNWRIVARNENKVALYEGWARLPALMERTVGAGALPFAENVAVLTGRMARSFISVSLSGDWLSEHSTIASWDFSSATSRHIPLPLNIQDSTRDSIRRMSFIMLPGANIIFFY